MMISRKLGGLSVAASVLLGLGASEAFAVEITGNGKSQKNDDGTLDGASICAVSRLDGPVDDPFGTTQNRVQCRRSFATSLPPLANTLVTPASRVAVTRP